MRHSLIKLALVVALLAAVASAEVTRQTQQDSTASQRFDRQAAFNNHLAEHTADVNSLKEHTEANDNQAAFRLHTVLDEARVKTIHAIAVDSARWHALDAKMHQNIARLDREMVENVGKLDATRNELHLLPAAIQHVESHLKHLNKKAIKVHTDISFATAEHKAEDASYATNSEKLNNELASVVALKNKLLSMEKFLLDGATQVTYAELAAVMTQHERRFRVPDAAHYETEVQHVTDEKHRKEAHILTAMKDFVAMVDKEINQVSKAIKQTNVRHETQSKLMTMHDALLANVLADITFDQRMSAEQLSHHKVRQLDLQRQEEVLVNVLNSQLNHHAALEEQAHQEAVAEDRKQRNLAHQRDVEEDLLALLEGRPLPEHQPFVATAERDERLVAEKEARDQREWREAHDAKIAAENKLRDEEEARVAKLEALTRAAHRSAKEQARHDKMVKEQLEDERRHAEYEKLRASKGKEAADAIMAAKDEARRYEEAKAKFMENDKKAHEVLLKEEAAKVAAGLAKLAAEHKAALEAAAETRAKESEQGALAVEHNAEATKDWEVVDEAKHRIRRARRLAKEAARKKAKDLKAETKFAAKEHDHAMEVKRELALARNIARERRQATALAHEAEAERLRGNWDTNVVKEESAKAQAKAAAATHDISDAASQEAQFLAAKKARHEAKLAEEAKEREEEAKARDDAAAAAKAAHEAAQAQVASQESARQAQVANEARERAAADQAEQDAVQKAHREAVAAAQRAQAEAAKKVADAQEAAAAATRRELTDHTQNERLALQKMVDRNNAKVEAVRAREMQEAQAAKEASEAREKEREAKRAADVAARQAELAKRKQEKETYHENVKSVFHH